MPLSEIEKTMDGGENLAGKKYQQFNFGLIKFEMSIKHPSEISIHH